MTGHVRRGSDIDLHVFSDSVEAVAAALDDEGVSYEVERKRVRKQGEEQTFVHIHVADRFPFELTIYAGDMAHYVFKSSITGKAIERASIAELEQFLAREYPGVSLDQSVLEAESRVDRFQIYEMLLLAVGEREGESRVSSRRRRPVPQPPGVRVWPGWSFPTTRSSCWRPCCTTSARRSIRRDHVAAGLEALAGHITPRTA